MTREQILSEIREEEKANGGVPLGRERLERETWRAEEFRRDDYSRQMPVSCESARVTVSVLVVAARTVRRTLA